MKRLFSLLVAVAMISIAMAAGPPNARAADPSLTTAVAKPKPKPVYTPVAGAIFNKPRGTKAEQLVIMNLLVRSTRSAPPGSTIRIAVYSFSYTPLASALMKAFRRGVIVKIIIDDHAVPRTVENLRLRKELNAISTDESWVSTCTFGCMSAKPSLMHAKLYQFSRSGTANYVTMISSANPAFAGATSSWNNNFTMIGDVATYESNKKYFNDMARDETNFNEIRNGWTTRVTKVPAPPTDVDEKPLDENDPRANDYRLDPNEDD